MPKDTASFSSHTAGTPIVVIGAGIGGLAAALRLGAAGHPVTVLERAQAPGGKMRTLPSAAGPVDAGPTVLTLKPVFEDLFACAGEILSDHVTLNRQSVLARHFWPDGSSLDLHADTARSIKAVHAFAGSRAARQFAAFSKRCKQLFDAFDAPMMRAPEPSFATLTSTVVRDPRLLRAMSPLRSMASQLARDFDDPRLAQLFGRYATYVGGSPGQSPALLCLIWQAEAAGVWTVEGGMHKLAQAIARLAEARGVQFHYGTEVSHLDIQAGAVTGVHTGDGTRHACAAAIFNGDPRALATGLLGEKSREIAAQTAKAPRSHSAQVWSFAAKASGVALAHHNVFFDADPAAEFVDLKAGRIPRTPSIYVCAEDRGDGAKPHAPNTPERFEIILNAPALTNANQRSEQEFETCRTRTFQSLAKMGLTFDQPAPRSALTTPTQFAEMFPASTGSLYGQSPHGMTAALARPVARTKIKGLYLAGGGCHPGAGVPMATLSGQHAAEAIKQDRISTSTSRQMATHGGTSTE